MKDLNKYKSDLKYDFFYNKLLSNNDFCFFQYADYFEFNGLLKESKDEFLKKKKKEYEDLGKTFNAETMNVREENNTFAIEEKPKTGREYLIRKPIDVLTKYDYRKLAFEIKTAQKNKAK